MNTFCVVLSDIGAVVRSINAESSKSDLAAALRKVQAVIAGYQSEAIDPLVMAICVLLIKALQEPDQDEAKAGFPDYMRCTHLMPLHTVQKFCLAPLFDEVRKSNARGERRAVFAQVWEDGAVLKALTTGEANGVAKLLNGSQTMFASAAERMAYVPGGAS